MRYAMKKLAILGSTGSIGQQTLDIVRAFPDRFQVVGLSGGRNTSLLAAQIDEFKPQLFYSPTHKLSSLDKSKLVSMEEMASHSEIDLVVIATSGKVGLMPALAAAKAGKQIALANKEILAVAGAIILNEVDRHQAQILPIDSEHSAIWQCLLGENNNEVNQILLTASGGPFFHHPPAQLSEVTVEKALHHPTWKMGHKVTIDSATLMNKGLEVIEAHWFFSVPFDKIQVLIHPQSIVHSLVEFTDGTLKAQLSMPDMHMPIQYALSYPERLPAPESPRLDLAQIRSLSFESVDYVNFPCLEMALEAGKSGGTYPAVLCAADEIAVELFLGRHLGFPGIAKVIAGTIDRHHSIDYPTLDDILSADAWARETAAEIATKGGLCS